MSIAALDLLLALVLPFLLGVAVLRALGIGWRSDRLAFAGWAWLCGSFATGLVVFLWLWTQPDTSSSTLPTALVCVLAIVLGFLARRRPVEELAPPEAESAPGWERVVFRLVLAGLLLLVAERVLLATNMPILSGDEGNFWALKAKLIHHCGGFDEAFRRACAEPQFVYNVDYPNLNPMLQVWTFAHAGGIVHVANRLPIQLFALAQLLIAAGALRRILRPSLAALLLLILVAPEEAHNQASVAQGDLMVGLGALVALDGWLRWQRERRAAAFRLMAVGLAFMLWSKNEGLLYASCIAAAAAFSCLVGRLGERPESQEGRRWPWLALPVGVIALHLGFNAFFGLGSGFLSNERREEGIFSLLVAQFSERCSTVLGYLAEHVFLDPAHSNLVFVALACAVLLLPGLVWKSALRAPFLALLLAFAGIAAVFVGAPHDLHWHLNTAAERVSFQLFPAALLCLAALAGLLGRRPA